jgi:NNP family nitrate/nitrite transporter-like MFS transporter
MPVAEGKGVENRPAGMLFRGLFLLTTLFFLNFTARVIFSPLLPIIEDELNIDHATAGSFFLLISAGYFFSILASGFVSSRINHKKTIILSTIATGLVLVVLSFCTTLWLMRIGLVGLGLAAGLYLPSGLFSIVRLVSPAYLARGMAVHELAPNLGFIAAPVLVDIMLRFCTWQQGLQWLGIVMMGAGIFYGTTTSGSREPGNPLDIENARKILSQPKFRLMILFFSLAICASLGIYAMLPLYLVSDLGITPERANRLLASSRTAALFMPLAAGWLGDRFGNKIIMGGALLLAGLSTTLLGMSISLPWVIFFVILQPMAAVCFFPSGFALLSAMGPEGRGGVAVSLCIPVAFLTGGGVLPALIGGIGDIASIGAGFILIGAAITAGAVFSFFVSFEKKDILGRTCG